MKAISLACAEISGVSSRRDHSVRLGLVTQELTPEHCAVLLSLHGSNVSALLTPLDVEAEGTVEVKMQDAPKTPSQQVRAVLFCLFKEMKVKGDFDEFYRKRMSVIINGLKNELEGMKS